MLEEKELLRLTQYKEQFKTDAREAEKKEQHHLFDADNKNLVRDQLKRKKFYDKIHQQMERNGKDHTERIARPQMIAKAEEQRKIREHNENQLRQQNQYEED